MKLGERMIARGLVSAEQVADALSAQMAYGGRLGTNLIELFHLELEVVADVLGQHHDLPPVEQRHFDRADPAVQARLPAEIAARWHAVPLGVLPDGSVLVAATDPLPSEALDELAEHLAGPLVLGVAPELRILYHLEKAYGVQRTNRFRRVGASRPGAADSDERRHYVRTLSDADEPPEPPSQLARIAVKRIAMAVSGEVELNDDVSTIEGAVRAMRRATGRDRLADIVVTALRRGFDDALGAGMVLSVRRGVLFGWRGFVRDADRHLVEAVAIPLAEPSLFRVPVTERRLFAGAPASGGDPLDHKLWLLLRTGPPAETVVVPIELRGKIVGVIYAHADTDISPRVVGGLSELGQGLAAAFDRLLRGAAR